MALNHPTDYFIHAGFRKVMMMVLRDTAADLMRKPGVADNDSLIKMAKEWVMHGSGDQGNRVPQPGVAFEACMALLGATGDMDAYRRGFLANPSIVQREAAQALTTINVAEGVYVDAAQSGVETLPVGEFNTSWLFQSARPDVSSSSA